MSKPAGPGAVQSGQAVIQKNVSAVTIPESNGLVVRGCYRVWVARGNLRIQPAVDKFLQAGLSA